MHGNCTTATVDTVALRKFRAICASKITVEITAFLPCSLMKEMEYNTEDVSIVLRLVTSNAAALYGRAVMYWWQLSYKTTATGDSPSNGFNAF